jgi:ribonuclease E
MSEGKVLINYVPGEECRVAITENGQLEEYHAEPTNAVSRVGNIYLGRVTNVEASIQAAFIDFGVEDAGFLHISDLHPQYFPGEDEETTERVGKKTPRRDRPPIQRALKRGQQIVVQVIKEGIGTKGPTLTSYLSIPGRFLVMMPQMDRVGVSRKVEDEDARAAMRKVLDTLDLPEGFGFILRTAGMSRTKMELKRDLAYLQRLWKDMEKRLATGKAPSLLYSESDLLVRSLRDLVTQDISEVVIDNETALRRAARFMKIVAPRSQAKLLHYKGRSPLFHAFGITEQIRQIHSRDVPLPGGGRLVIDETEALVAVDVNSGKMRSARDAETNAFQVNLESVDVICRQIRLRDLGGLVICDLIDMRNPKNRKTIENRFRERLRRDRARSTTLPISSFGILEMTRQRMRGSHESVHFATCPSCRGRGLLQKPDSVAADALQDLAALLDHDRVAKVEMVVNQRVAAALLSTRRAALTRIEHLSGKIVDVRISDALQGDRVTYYAYDETGADIGIEKLPGQSRKPELVDWFIEPKPKDDNGWAVDMRAEAEEVAEQTAEAFAEAQAALEEMQHETGLLGLSDDESEDEAEGQPKKKRRRRRRGRRRGGSGDENENAQDQSRGESESDESQQDVPAHETSAEARVETDDEAEGEAPAKKKRRRRRRRRSSDEARGEDGAPSDNGEVVAAKSDSEDASEIQAEPSQETEPEADFGDAEDAPVKKKRRRRRRSKSTDVSSEAAAEETKADEPLEASSTQDDGEQASDDGDEPAPVKKKRRRSRSRKPAASDDGEATGNDVPTVEVVSQEVPAPEPKPRRRSLYGASRRKLSPAERSRAAEE